MPRTDNDTCDLATSVGATATMADNGLAAIPQNNDSVVLVADAVYYTSALNDRGATPRSQQRRHADVEFPGPGLRPAVFAAVGLSPAARRGDRAAARPPIPQDR